MEFRLFSPTSSKRRRTARSVYNADESISRRGFAGRRTIVPRLRRIRAHGRGPNTGTLVGISPGARVGIRREMPMGDLALASHDRSCKHGCDDHRSRNEFKLGHSTSPYGSEKKPLVLAPPERWRRDRPIKGTSSHVSSTPREVIASSNHGFRRLLMKCNLSRPSSGARRCEAKRAEIVNWFLIENPASNRHVGTHPEPRLRC